MKQLTASQQKDIITNFTHKLGARATITSKTMRRVEPITFDPYGAFTYNDRLTTYEEQIVALEIPMSSFEKLAENSHDIDDLRAHFGPNIDEMGQRIIIADYERRREARVRADNPAVQKAWERYQTLLKIAGG